MAAVSSSAQAPSPNESSFNGVWLVVLRLALAATLLLCVLQVLLRVHEARLQAGIQGTVALGLIEEQHQDALGFVLRPHESIENLRYCRGAQCTTVYERNQGNALCEAGASWLDPCVTVASSAHAGNLLRVRFDMLRAITATWLDVASILAILAGVLFLSHRAAARLALASGTGQNADLDPLTGLLNRVAFEAAFKRHNEARAHAGGSGCLLYCDLDRFKIINDTHGHTAGDQVLRTVATRLRYALGNEVLIGRLGGDEFAILMPDVSSPATVEQVGRVLVEQVIKPIRMGAISESVGLSMGAFMLGQHTLTVGDMLHRADLAMYEAKRTGRGHLVFFEESMDKASRTRAQIQVDLWKALRERQMFMVYQPQFDGQDQIRGVESLVRWQHPTQGVLAADAFIPIAEQTGLIVPLGKLVIDLVCTDLVAWRTHGLPLPYVSVNLSLRQLAAPGFVDDVQAALQRHRLSATDIEFEVIESTAMVGQGGEESAALKKLSKMGFRIAIDDFGTGYSSMGRLLDLKVDKLKIDKVFVAAISKPRFDPALLELMISLAKRLGVKSVAEGVETPEQVKWLRQAGCQMMQGDFCAQPMTRAQLLTWLDLQKNDGGFEDGVWAPTETSEDFHDSEQV
ncbi:MAG: bifunctional diguanylate cyclase/phosphodiesterase [Aquabacterium sp.]